VSFWYVYFSSALKSRLLERLAVIDPVERERRIQIYRRATPLFGTVQPAAVLKDAERFGHILHGELEMNVTSHQIPLRLGFNGSAATALCMDWVSRLLR
jgi:hypothetical protein